MFVQGHQMSTAPTELCPQNTQQVLQRSAISYLSSQNHRQHLQSAMGKTIHEGPNNRLPAEYNFIDKLSAMTNGGDQNVRAGNAAEKFAADRLNNMVVVARKGPSSSTHNAQLAALAELEKRGGKTAPDSSIKLTGNGLVGGGGKEKIAKLLKKMHIGGPSERTKYYSQGGRYREWSPSPSPPRRSPPPGYEPPPPNFPPGWHPPSPIVFVSPEPSTSASSSRSSRSSSRRSQPSPKQSPSSSRSSRSSSTSYYSCSGHSLSSSESSGSSMPSLETVSSPDLSAPRQSSFEKAYPQDSQFGNWW
jgi:hypothetical protein